MRIAIAEALWSAVSSGDLPDACERLGLRTGNVEEAHSSKRKYVRARIAGHNMHDLMSLAKEVIDEFDVPELVDFVDERTTHAQHRVTDLTRRAVLAALDDVADLFGGLAKAEGLTVLGPNAMQNQRIGYSGVKDFLPNSENLVRYGALTCSQQRFFNLIEQLLSPVCRQGEEQQSLMTKLNVFLAADGFTLAVVSQMSRHPVYGVRRIAVGVKGTPKNLIFAAINSKPDLYLTDAINNDVAVTNNSDALIYDWVLTESGLSWTAMVAWWKETHGSTDSTEARRRLYIRLLESVKTARSPGEFVLFDTFYRDLAAIYGDKLPALIPQVYLHFDPKTAYQRGADPVLIRQRMDLLLLLDRNVRIVIEVDGRHHYADDEKASPSRYARMAAEDRRLRLLGYEVYRFGAAEFFDSEMDARTTKVGPKSRELAREFFKQLFLKHGVNV